jgi:hypothetical protein
VSKISLAPDASGTGIFTIASPNSNTNRTLTLPDDTGTIVTNSGNQAGSFTTLNTSGAVVFNDAGADVDFRVESDTVENALFVDGATGNVGIGTTSPSEELHVYRSSGQVWNRTETGGSVNDAGVQFKNGVRQWSTFVNGTDGAYRIYDDTAASERVRIDSSGNVGIGTSSPAKLQAVIGSGASVGVKYLNAGGSGLQFYTDSTVSNADTFIESPLTGVAMIFKNGGTERARITSDGAFLIGKTTAGITTAGVEFRQTLAPIFTQNGQECLFINRGTNDGTLIDFRQDNTPEGSISVSGSTVSYNGGHLSRWAQMLT